MRIPITAAAAMVVALACTSATSSLPAMSDPTPDPAPFHALQATTIDGKPFSFEGLKGHKVMVVNTASECGFTPQYKQLEELYTHYKDKGFIILGFPSNDFGGQEPGDEATIAQFCERNYGVTFQLMSKVRTQGEGQSPVYAWLTRKALNGKADSDVRWNFQKYLIDERGELVDVLPSAQEPMSERVISWLEGQ